MGEGDVQADESPLARAANQLRIPLRERRKLSTAATEVAKSVADDEPARRSEREEILRALEGSAREVLAAAVRAQRAEESGEEPSTPVAEDNGHVERLCAAVQAALDHRACATCAGWGSGIGEMLRLDRLKIVGASDAARPPEARTAAAALEAFERDLEPASSRFNVFRPQAATGPPGGATTRGDRDDPRRKKHHPPGRRRRPPRRESADGSTAPSTPANSRTSSPRSRGGTTSHAREDTATGATTPARSSPTRNPRRDSSASASA